MTEKKYMKKNKVVHNKEKGIKHSKTMSDEPYMGMMVDYYEE